MKQRRKRRSTSEVREAILRASMDLFLINGYEATSTKAIAEAARVQEPLIFRHFSTKAELLEHTIVHSLQTLVRECEREFDETHPAIRKRTTDYTLRLYELLSKERELLVAMFATNGGRRADHPIHETLAPLFDRLTAMGRRHVRPGGPDPWFVVRLTFGLIVSAIVLEGWLFPRQQRSKLKQLPRALAQYVSGASLAVRKPVRRRGKGAAQQH